MEDTKRKRDAKEKEDEEYDEEEEEEEEEEGEEEAVPAPAAKKRRTSAGGAGNLKERLASLPSEQVLDYIVDFVENQHPEVKGDFVNNIPRPSLNAIKEELKAIEKKYNAAFPNTRYGSSFDHYSFKRVRPMLMEFKKALLAHGVALKKAGFWPSLLEYCDMASEFAANMPDWDQAKNHTAKNATYKAIAGHWKAALKKADLSVDALERWKAKIEKFNEHAPTIPAKKDTTEKAFAGVLADLEKLLARKRKQK